MPETSGLELREAMNSEDMGIPIGVVSSRSRAEMIEAAQGAGAKVMLTKPFTPDTFRAALAPIFS